MTTAVDPAAWRARAAARAAEAAAFTQLSDDACGRWLDAPAGDPDVDYLRAVVDSYESLADRALERSRYALACAADLERQAVQVTR